MSRPERVAPVRAVDVSPVSMVIRFVRERGFPCAVRRPLASGRELGVVGGTPGVEWGVKSPRGPVEAGQLAGWLVALEAHRVRADARIAVLVVPRPVDGDPGDWLSVLVLGPGRCSRLPLSDALSALVSMGFGGGPGPDGPGAA